MRPCTASRRPVGKEATATGPDWVRCMVDPDDLIQYGNPWTSRIVRSGTRPPARVIQEASRAPKVRPGMIASDCPGTSNGPSGMAIAR